VFVAGGVAVSVGVCGTVFVDVAGCVGVTVWVVVGVSVTSSVAVSVGVFVAVVVGVLVEPRAGVSVTVGLTVGVGARMKYAWNIRSFAIVSTRGFVVPVRSPSQESNAHPGSGTADTSTVAPPG